MTVHRIIGLAVVLVGLGVSLANGADLPELSVPSGELNDTYDAVSRILLKDLPAGAIVAYEEHRLFTYGVAEAPGAGASGGGRDPRLVRRLVLLKPSTLLMHDGSALAKTFTTDQAKCDVNLPPWHEGAGEIAILDKEGKTILERRPLASGVLPRGPEGARLLDRWDSAYRGGRRPGWDHGRPASDLKKAVEDGSLRPCRVVELGCGLGTDSIYLAGRGFDVTAIDIAPTALARAAQKAREARVKVRWLLANVLAPPKLEPFELIYDRGCYHGVRRQSAAGYVESLRRLSRAGTQVLILAGNANEARHYGPPRVREQEIRADFSPLFEFQWLRETHFDTSDPNRQGALAWSILLRRKASEKAGQGFAISRLASARLARCAGCVGHTRCAVRQ